MRILKRLARSVIKRLPGGKDYLLKRWLFRPCSGSIYQGQHGLDKTADAVYLPAFDKIFLLLSAFYSNGLRGDILEFGVMYGYTARILADCISRFKLKDVRLHLFDSFEGLPTMSEEDQNSYEIVNGTWSKGALCTPPGLEGILEKKLRKRIGTEKLFVVKGYFERTLEQHIREKKINKAILINLDCDLYSSSKYVLRTLFEYDLVQDGALLICDDWMTSFGNPNLGQRKAVQEILQEHPQWEFEPYMNYGIGSQVFVMHDLSIAKGKKLENTSRGTHKAGRPS